MHYLNAMKVSDLSSFGTHLNVAIIGASGGIGSAFVELFSNHDSVKTVYAFSRQSIDFYSNKVISGQIDLSDEDSIQAAAHSIDEELDIIIVATGFLHDDATMPEKSLRDLSLPQLEKVFLTNTFGPAIVMKHFLSRIPKNRKSVFAALSARVGSIEDNRLGGWHAYRASKTALNMLLKNAAIETARRYKEAHIIGLHPGTVDTGLSKPFQSNVKDGKLFTPDYSAQSLIDVINTVSPEDSGKVFAWDGQKIPA